ncbi:alanine/glycine:cation symporter family protein [Shewanella subflava]|uniref:Alanine:cation symporter family protein n=1 Tax=Shewanella subflava TaxID=2986476 RepID=A0ABT3IAK1_9GAMM|nr:alanine/glycine:cation symporter family protein [Shewanella subflava]MCW3173087.1 alanine:cation symporter family protein [Shewanella subflava]
MTLVELTQQLADMAWGPHMLILLVGGGLFFLIYSRFVPFRYIGHAINIVRGKYPDDGAEGHISHAGALSSAMAGTVGMGNIGSVAVAIMVGGPGAIFWMWISAIVGMATKFFTCTLAIMYRGKDENGDVQGGPMYIITQGLAKKWHFLAVFFCVVGLVGNFPLFNSNQLVQIIREWLIVKPGYFPSDQSTFMVDLGLGIIVMLIVASVILGGIKRIATVASKIVPLMIFIYMSCAFYVIATNLADIPGYFALIFTEAFSLNSVGGGILGTMLIGIRRAAFSNEAGIGTEVMAHGSAKTNEPVKEGLVAMLGPAIDTLMVCTATAMIILISGVWQGTESEGVNLSAQAFSVTMPGVGPYLLILCVVFFSISTIFTQAFYGGQCFAFLFGRRHIRFYQYFYLLAILFAATASLQEIVNIIDAAYALMAIPTMTSAILLAPKVREASKKYFAKLAAVN